MPQTHGMGEGSGTPSRSRFVVPLPDRVGLPESGWIRAGKREAQAGVDCPACMVEAGFCITCAAADNEIEVVHVTRAGDSGSRAGVTG